MVVMGEAGQFNPSRFIWFICQLFAHSHKESLIVTLTSADLAINHPCPTTRPTQPPTLGALI